PPALRPFPPRRASELRAAELYSAHVADPGAVDPNVLPALIAVLAYAGDAARYDEFLRRFRAATTPQEEQRYLYALAGFHDPALADRKSTSELQSRVEL